MALVWSFLDTFLFRSWVLLYRMDIYGRARKLDSVGSGHEPWSLSCQVEERRPVGEVGDVGEDMLQGNGI